MDWPAFLILPNFHYCFHNAKEIKGINSCSRFFIAIDTYKSDSLPLVLQVHVSHLVWTDFLENVYQKCVSMYVLLVMNQNLHGYLCSSDRFDKSEGIVVIGATNFPEVLDK